MTALYCNRGDRCVAHLLCSQISEAVTELLILFEF